MDPIAIVCMCIGLGITYGGLFAAIRIQINASKKEKE